jgi:hypothetical protein
LRAILFYCNTEAITMHGVSGEIAGTWK